MVCGFRAVWICLLLGMVVGGFLKMWFCDLRSYVSFLFAFDRKLVLRSSLLQVSVYYLLCYFDFVFGRFSLLYWVSLFLTYYLDSALRLFSLRMYFFGIDVSYRFCFLFKGCAVLVGICRVVFRFCLFEIDLLFVLFCFFL